MCEHPRGRAAPVPSNAATQPTQPTQAASEKPPEASEFLERPTPPHEAAHDAWTAVNGMLDGLLQDSQLGGEPSPPLQPHAVDPPLPPGCSPAGCSAWVLTGSKLTEDQQACLERMATMFGGLSRSARFLSVFVHQQQQQQHGDPPYTGCRVTARWHDGVTHVVCGTDENRRARCVVLIQPHVSPSITGGRSSTCRAYCTAAGWSAASGLPTPSPTGPSPRKPPTRWPATALAFRGGPVPAAWLARAVVGCCWLAGSCGWWGRPVGGLTWSAWRARQGRPC